MLNYVLEDFHGFSRSILKYELSKATGLPKPLLPRVWAPDRATSSCVLQKRTTWHVQTGCLQLSMAPFIQMDNSYKNLWPISLKLFSIQLRFKVLMGNKNHAVEKVSCGYQSSLEYLDIMEKVSYAVDDLKSR